MGTEGQAASPLRATHVLEFPFTRSVGPVLSRFFTALRDERQFLGARTRSGQVIVPPQEYDAAGEAIAELVPVGPGGEIVSWSWVTAPRARAPLPRPFAWALIRLDGASTSLLHAVDAQAESRLARGRRVRPRWAEPRSGSIGDVVCFELED
jgi:uncharacterized OB-fold protein